MRVRPLTLKKVILKNVNWKNITIALLVTGTAWLAWSYLASKTNEARTRQHFNQVLQEKQQELDSRLQELDKKKLDAKQLEEAKRNLEAQKAELEKQLQAKREREAKDRAVAHAETVKKASQPKPAPIIKKSFGGNCSSWLAAAGVTDTNNAMELIRRESGCNPYAVNKSSGACGVAQELPCGKSGCSLGDGGCQVKWMNRYVIQRYKSWAAAVEFHNRNNWY